MIYCFNELSEASIIVCGERDSNGARRFLVEEREVESKKEFKVR